MFVTCIFNNMDRQKSYLIEPTNQKLVEIIDHERHISKAISETNIHSQRIVQTFKDQVGYEGCMMKFISKNALEKSKHENLNGMQHKTLSEMQHENLNELQHENLN